jgi:hypothetical protein
MKTKILLTIVPMLIVRIGLSQGFLNLSFESANPSGYVPGNNLPTSVAFPGWTAYYSSASGTNIASTVYYDSVSAGGAAILLEDSNAPSGGGPLPIQGNFSVLLEGGNSIYNPPGEQYSASIGQTGTIPNTAKTLTFWGNIPGGMQITFNGQPLSFIDISNTLNYAIWGADISAYAGQSGQLLFTAPGGLPYSTGGLIDNIQFTSLPVPEPSEIALTALGAMLLGFRRWRNSLG